MIKNYILWNTMETIIYVMIKRGKCVIELIMFYGSKGTKPKNWYGLLSCFLYSIIENYVWIDYLSCQSKTLSSIYSNRIFEQKRFNTLLGIGIPEVLLNVVSCHRFM